MNVVFFIRWKSIFPIIKGRRGRYLYFESYPLLQWRKLSQRLSIETGGHFTLEVLFSFPQNWPSLSFAFFKIDGSLASGFETI